jgi:hypothetical protein
MVLEVKYVRLGDHALELELVDDVSSGSFVVKEFLQTVAVLERLVEVALELQLRLVLEKALDELGKDLNGPRDGWLGHTGAKVRFETWCFMVYGPNMDSK